MRTGLHECVCMLARVCVHLRVLQNEVSAFSFLFFSSFFFLVCDHGDGCQGL